jgi:hypothetical protein
MLATVVAFLCVFVTISMGRKRLRTQPNKAIITRLEVLATAPREGEVVMYPVKLYVTCRNDSQFPVEVCLSSYEPALVSHRQFNPGVLTILMGQKWLPLDHGVDRLAVLPGQLFKAWVGVDEKKCDAAKVNESKGRIGTIVFQVNGEAVAFDL